MCPGETLVLKPGKFCHVCDRQDDTHTQEEMHKSMRYAAKLIDVTRAVQRV